MQAILQPRRRPISRRAAGTLFRAMRSEDSEEGEPLVLDANVFIETVLAKSIIRQLKRARDACHRAPFRDRAARRPTLIGPRELPIEGEPADVAALRDFVTGVTSERGLWRVTSRSFSL
jgi:haloalkane dehalogenase